MFYSFNYSQDYKKSTHTVQITDLSGNILSPRISYTANSLPSIGSPSPHFFGNYILAITTEGLKIFDIKSDNLIKSILAKEPIYRSNYSNGMLIYQTDSPGKNGKLIGVQI